MRLTPASAALATAISLQSSQVLGCDSNTVTISTQTGPAIVDVEIADDSQERAEGLSGRTSLAASSGMLFVYDEPHRARFWMLGTKIALDMIFIEPDGTISGIEHDVQPGTYWPKSGGSNVIAVLEINGGEAEDLGIRANDQVMHPMLNCEPSE